MTDPRVPWRAPVCHDLKAHPKPFGAVRDGRKWFEIRLNDRDYREGDIVMLREFIADPDAWRASEHAAGNMIGTPKAGYTGACDGPFLVGYVEKTPGCVPDGYCGFGLIRLVPEGEDVK